MKITKEQIKKLKPCRAGYEWFINHGSPDLLKTLLAVNKVKPEWASWLYLKLMTAKRQKQFSIAATEEVLPIFEALYPKVNHLRLAIESAKNTCKSNTAANRAASHAFMVSTAVYSESDGPNTTATSIAAAVSDAVYASFASKSETYAHTLDVIHFTTIAVAGYNTTGADGYNDVGAAEAMQEKLIRKAVKMLEKK